MRNGMSVREIYERLDRLDRLEAACDKLRREKQELVTKVSDAIWKIDTTIRVYDSCRRVEDNDEATIEEFTNRIKGLTEAKQILKNVFTTEED